MGGSLGHAVGFYVPLHNDADGDALLDRQQTRRPEGRRLCRCPLLGCRNCFRSPSCWCPPAVRCRLPVQIWLISRTDARKGLAMNLDSQSGSCVCLECNGVDRLRPVKVASSLPVARLGGRPWCRLWCSGRKIIFLSNEATAKLDPLLRGG